MFPRALITRHRVQSMLFRSFHLLPPLLVVFFSYSFFLNMSGKRMALEKSARVAGKYAIGAVNLVEERRSR